jgi:hypothetical protein
VTDGLRDLLGVPVWVIPVLVGDAVRDGVTVLLREPVTLRLGVYVGVLL